MTYFFLTGIPFIHPLLLVLAPHPALIFLWPPVPYPPKKYWKLLSHFIQCHITPRLSRMEIQWFHPTEPRFTTSFFKHRVSPHLFHRTGTEMSMFRICPKPRSRSKAIYLNAPYTCSMTYSEQDFFPVDTHYDKMGILVVGSFYHSITYSTSEPPSSLLDTFLNLDSSLQHLCGDVYLPPDNGKALIKKINNSSNILYGSSDASLEDKKSSHAWILSSGDIGDINDLLLHISGSGPVDGLPSRLS
jgi:hypothetical protein